MFRPAKKRKFIRQHEPREEGEVDTVQVDSPLDHLRPAHNASSGDSGVASILKLRRQQKSRTGGVQFSNSKFTATDETASSHAVVPAEDAADNLTGIADRFVGHSAQVVDVDKHMVAYIDSEMAKRRTAHASTEHTQPDTDKSHHPSTNETPSTTPQPSTSTRQPVSQGLLNEVEVKDRLPPSLDPLPPKPRKPRLDRFGRPLPPRNLRKGRTPSDIARDKLVEEIINETGLDVYDNPRRQEQSLNDNGGGGGGGDDDADARLASQFQADYLDALASRQAAQKKAAPGAEPGQKGPKLGGSRQQRAAMRERELKDEKEKGKGGAG